MTQTVENLFITRDVNKTFNMIEDENGDKFWGYGHRDGSEFSEEVNRWLIHACGVTHPDDLFAANTTVEHLWARMDDECGEHFTLVTYPDPEAGVFPVTRLTT